MSRLIIFVAICLLLANTLSAQEVDLRQNLKVGTSYRYSLETADDVETGVKGRSVQMHERMKWEGMQTVFAGETAGTKRIEQHWLSLVVDTTGPASRLHFDSKDVPKADEKPTPLRQQWEKDHHYVVTTIIDAAGEIVSQQQQDERATPGATAAQGGVVVLHDEGVQKKLVQEWEYPALPHAAGSRWSLAASGMFDMAGMAEAMASYHFRATETLEGHACAAVEMEATVKDVPDPSGPFSTYSLESGTIVGTQWLAADLGVVFQRHLEKNAVIAQKTELGNIRMKLKHAEDFHLLSWELADGQQAPVANDATPLLPKLASPPR